MILRVADLELDTDSHTLTCLGKNIPLTRQEYKLLLLLLENKNTLLTRSDILTHLWHAHGNVKTRVVDVYVGYLRKKIDLYHHARLIQSVYGKGYMIADL